MDDASECVGEAVKPVIKFEVLALDESTAIQSIRVLKVEFT